MESRGGSILARAEVVYEECPPYEEMEGEIPGHDATDPLLRLAQMEVRYVRAVRFDAVSCTVRRYRVPEHRAPLP